jgi:Rnl2 family RNA ligase
MWLKYPKIESFKSKYYAVENFNDDVYWVAVEKIHGSNFSIYVTGTNKFEYYRRNGNIDKEEKFYGYEETVKMYTNSLNMIYNKINKPFILYGEYFGGKYDHIDCKNIDILHKEVQKEIQYTPNTNFIPFDIIFDPKECDCKFEDYSVFIKLMEEVGFKTPPVWCKGDLKTVFEFNVNNKVTKIPELFGLSEIQENFIEGVILRPSKDIYRKNFRVMYKNKTKDFCEKSGNKYKEVKELDPIIKEFVERIMPYVTSQRLNNLLSKESEYFKTQDKNFGEIIKKFGIDVYEDVVTDKDDYEYYEEFMKNKPNLIKEAKNIIVRNSVILIRTEIFH